MANRRSIGMGHSRQDIASRISPRSGKSAHRPWRFANWVACSHLAFTKADRFQMQPDYLVYTTKFDREVRANDLDSVLGPLGPKDRAAVDEAWHELQKACFRGERNSTSPRPMQLHGSASF